MKKIYIEPQVEVVNVEMAQLIAESLPQGSTPIENEDGVLVKEEASPSYNVWDDDWRD